MTASRDKRLMVWSSETGDRLEPSHTLGDALTALDIGPAIDIQSSHLVAVGFERGGLQLGALSLAPECRSQYTALWTAAADWAHMGVPVKRLLFNGDRLASCGEDGLVRVFSIRPNSLKDK